MVLKGSALRILHDWSKTDWCSLRRTGHYPVPRLEHLANWPLSGFLSANPLKFIGLSGVPPDCPVRQRSNSQLRPTVDCADCGEVCSTEVANQSATSGNTGLSSEPSEQLSSSPNGRLRRLRRGLQRRSQETICDDRSHRTVGCATELFGAARRQNTSTIKTSKPQRSADVALTGQ